MMARIIHIGHDTQFRARVLKSTGHRVDVVTCVASFQQRLAERPIPDAAAVTEDAHELSIKCAAMLRAASVPLIYFEGGLSYSPVHGRPSELFELADIRIAPLTRPDAWLEKVEQFVDESRALRAQLQAACGMSEHLQAEAARLCAQSASEVEKFRTLEAKIRRRRIQTP